jgi:tRNA wybutosine-synthesizing protein 1
LTDLSAVLRHQGYSLVGRHSGVKTCHWLKASLTKGEACYKEKFYGIRSHRCIQMSPALSHCSNNCIYCWRVLPNEGGEWWEGVGLPDEDGPAEIAQGSIDAHRKCLNGFKGNPSVKPEKWMEAMDPRHVAISLSGEPTSYSKLDGLLEEFRSRGMTTFLVTNGTNPGALKRIRDPTQLYISLSAPSEEAYGRVCRPSPVGNWWKLMESLAMLRSFRCPTVIRITAVRGWNMIDAAGYARIIEKSAPTYVEVKAYMHVGSSIGRLSFESMPGHGDIVEFAREIASESGYAIGDEVPISRVVLLKSGGKSNYSS